MLQLTNLDSSKCKNIESGGLEIAEDYRKVISSIKLLNWNSMMIKFINDLKKKFDISQRETLKKFISNDGKRF